MAYFVKSPALADVDALRANADTLGESTTVIFEMAGTFYFKVENPKIGEKFGALNDVSLIEFPENAGIIQDVTIIDNVTLFQVIYHPAGSVFQDPYYTLKSTSTSQILPDQVLQARYPTYINNSTYGEATVTPGSAEPGALAEFYLAVSGSRGVFDDAYAYLHLDAPYDGRALVVRNTFTGERDAIWGKWLDTLRYDANQEEPVTDPAAAELAELIAKQEEKIIQTEWEISEKLKQLDLLKVNIELKKELVSGLQEAEKYQLYTNVLNGLALSGSIASLFIPYEYINLVYKTLDRSKQLTDVYDATQAYIKEPNLENLAKFGESTATYLVDGKEAFRKIEEFLKIKSAVNQAEKTFRDINDRSITTEQIDSALKAIERMETEQIKLQNELMSIRKLNIERSSELLEIKQSDHTLEFGSNYGKKVFAFSDNQNFSFDEISGGKNTAFSFLGHKQSLTAASGEALIDGTEGSFDTVVVSGDRASFREYAAGDHQLVLEGDRLSAIAIEVERVQFNDGILAFDTDSGENAGNAYRIYKAAFDREPDQQGLSFWTKWLDDGKTDPWNMAARFIDSREFEELYGSRNPDNADYMLRVYRNVLDRDPDQGGYDWWLERLNNSTFSQSEVLARFSDSVENRENVTPKVENGVFLSNEYFFF